MKKEEFWAKQYRRHIAKMVGVCYRYVADWQVAEDLAQDAFLTAMEKSGTLRFWESIESWLMRIVVNKALMYLRDWPEMVALEEEPMDVVEDQPDELTENQVKFSQEELLEAIGKLPAKQRTVFNLYAVEHCSHAKIAETLGISVTNSKVLLSRARNELQGILTVMARKRKLAVSNQ